MPLLTYAKTITVLRQRKFFPVFFWEGDESYLMHRLYKTFIEAIPVKKNSFNLHLWQGQQTDLQTVINCAYTAPMLGNKRFLLVKSAEQLDLFQNEEQEKKILNYIERPSYTSVLVFMYQSKFKKKKIFEILKKHTMLTSIRPIRQHDIQPWIKDYMTSYGKEITPNALLLLTHLLGDKLFILANELDKIYLYYQDRKMIDEKMIKSYVGLHRDFNYEELQRACIERNHKNLFIITNYFGKNSKKYPFLSMLGLLTHFFTKLLIALHVKTALDRKTLSSLLQVHPYFVRQYQQAMKNYTKEDTIRIIRTLHQVDLMAKGIGFPPVNDATIWQKIMLSFGR